MTWLLDLWIAGGAIIYLLYAVLLIVFFVGGVYERFLNRNVRIYSGLALTIALEGRFFVGAWPFDTNAFFSKVTLSGIGNFWLVLVVPVLAALAALVIETIIFQAIKHKQERRPEFIRRTYVKFNYEFVFLYLFSPVLYGGVILYAEACGLIQ